MASSLGEALALGAAAADDVFIVGGAEVYRAALPVADRLELTEVHAEPEGDTWFPTVDWSRWSETSRDDREGFAFVTYEPV